MVREKTYELAANYKLIGENFLEYHHLPWVHPELMQVSRMEDHFRWQEPGLYSGFCTTPISQNSESGGWQGLPPVSTLRGEDAESGRFVLLFPNTAISVLPNHAFIIVANTDGPHRTVESTVILSHPESLGNPGAEEELDQLMHFWDLVNLQDIKIEDRARVVNGM